jgi:hypothetical protein
MVSFPDIVRISCDFAGDLPTFGYEKKGNALCARN